MLVSRTGIFRGSEGGIYVRLIMLNKTPVVLNLNWENQEVFYFCKRQTFLIFVN